jgi:hypothetical protein
MSVWQSSGDFALWLVRLGLLHARRVPELFLFPVFLALFLVSWLLHGVSPHVPNKSPHVPNKDEKGGGLRKDAYCTRHVAGCARTATIVIPNAVRNLLCLNNEESQGDEAVSTLSS